MPLKIITMNLLSLRTQTVKPPELPLDSPEAAEVIPESFRFSVYGRRSIKLEEF